MTQTESKNPSAERHRMVMPWQRMAGLRRRLTQTTVAIVPLALLAMGVHPAIAVIPAIYPFFILIRRGYRRLRRHVGRTALAGEHGIRLLLGLLPLGICWAQGTTGPLGWVTTFLFALVPLSEPVVTRVAPGRKLRVANLPGIPDHRGPAFPVNLVLVVDLALTALASLLLLVHVPAGALVPLPLIALAIAGYHALDSFRRVRDSVNADNNLYGAVEALAPKFVLYYGVPAGSAYQVGMWIEYLERIGEPFIVVLRKTSAFREITRLTDAPVVVRTNIWQLDDVITPSITTAFYVNNSAPNVHLVRYPQITHVQLLHGDSDKASSFNPVTALYDRIFVAGQAAIDRYENNGVEIPQEKFTIVGRPQVETVEQQGPENIPVRTVLYAPTWEGHYADTNYGSLPVGPHIVRALLERGMTVVFRPHPFSYRNPEAAQNINAIKQMLREDAESGSREHLWGHAAEKELDAFGCFNAADAMISDVSSVVPDFLYSGKPYGLVTMSYTVAEFERMFPLARSAYVIPKDLSNLDEMLDQLLVTDPKAEARKQTRVDYLGPFPAENYADAFVGAARNVVLHDRKPVAAQNARTEGADEGVADSRMGGGGESAEDATRALDGPEDPGADSADEDD
ncbi:CDP-glycerol glycerophosphotransferase family protein [Brachybacterium kimchii]|uniref:CDP-glycerol glycerophosphotransferase family protein n=1 Tax=Brachybacterium kimchii TaxID=2942909 RepID=A0ABY4N0I9_9MICO|nr:CDP-glycerol glycerophosphotransferase family protein [Brachybacterium kimchii]UQN28062.1 CDP-glycerol glycerophosphotransferase family protein [Brachybacterium kimchii]